MDITNQTAEGKVFDFLPETSIKSDELKIFPFESRSQRITTETKEFSAVCPFSGLPDIAYLKIEYIPNGYCIELKSLKYYLTSFRNVGIYQEGVTMRIYDDLQQLLKTPSLKVTTVYNTRGGFDTTCSEGTI